MRQLRSCLVPRSEPAKRRSLSRGAWCIVVGLGVFLGTTSPAFAAPSAADKKAADALFKDGREHVEAGDYGVACPKFLASYKLDPASSTLLNLADCHQRAGHTATAYDRFLEALALAKKLGRTDREKTARERIDALEPKLTKVELRVKEKGDVTITRDGVPLTAEDAAAPMRVDPGPHTFFISANGKKSFSATVSAIEEGKTYTIDVPALAAEGDEDPVVPAVGKPKTGPGTPGGEGDSPGSGRRIASLVLGGAGLVIAGVGGYFGIRTFSSWSDSKARCNDKGCDREGVDLASDAKTSGFISTIGLAAGGALFATGVILFLTAPSKPEKSSKKAYFLPSAGPSSVGVLMGGVF